MSKAFNRDLERLQAHAFDRAECAEACLRRYHAAAAKIDAAIIRPLRTLYDWLFVPVTLWPFNIQDVLVDCLTSLEKGKRLNARHRLIIDLLPEPPDESICAAAVDHELHVQKGIYENVVKSQAKYGQKELVIKSDPELRRQWADIKAAFDVRTYQDYKGVIRRSMTVERNLRPSFSVNLRRREDAFHAAFDAFCLRWNLYGMQHDEPLLLKLAVNLTPYGTMIHIPAYWSFDPKRDIRGMPLPSCIASAFPDAKVPRWPKALPNAGRSGETAATGFGSSTPWVERGKEHEFLCTGLGWDVRTSAKRLSRLRTEFKNRSY